LKVRSADFGPLLDLKPADTLAQNIGLSSRVQLTGNKLTFDDLDSSAGGSRLRGSVAVTLGEEKEIEGEIGAEQLALAPAFALAIGAAGHDAAEPLGTGLAKGWRGRIAFQALRGLLPGGSELQPVSGVIKSDGLYRMFYGDWVNICQATSSDGLVISARAIAVRCICPPESSFG